MLTECEVSEVHGIMATASTHEFYPIRYMGNLIVHYIDSKEGLESIGDSPKLVQYIELYCDIVATYTNSERGQETGILELIKNI